MSSITVQRDRVVIFKKETLLNVGIVSKLHPMPSELSKQIFNENALEKPTQNMFNHLSRYLVCVIDSNYAASMSWPLYDTKTERAYRNELSAFISNYSSKGLLSPVLSSYLVNPGCYKVTKLMFQLSQLAIQKVLEPKLNGKQKKVYDEMTEKSKTETEGFWEDIEKETTLMSSKFSNYLIKRKSIEKIAEIMRNKITEMENKIQSLKAQEFLDNIVDGFLKNHTLDEYTKTEILKIKNVKQKSQFFDSWLYEVDLKIAEMESKWDEKVSPLTDLCTMAQTLTESLVSRYTGEVDKSTYMIEYNNTNTLNTLELQQQVNTQQKYILKNIIQDNKLNFPNLIRGFLVAICFIFKNAEVEDVGAFKECLDVRRAQYSQMVEEMRAVVNRVMNADAKLKLTPQYYHSTKSMTQIPSLPDLTDLRSTRDLQCQVLFDSFTPISVSKHQFNLHRKHNFSFIKPQSNYLTTPFCKPPNKDDFMRSVISCQISNYNPNLTNYHNSSVLQTRANETVTEGSGFTKQQIMRLLSTKKSSSSKKFKHKVSRPEFNVKKLFNQSTSSNDSTVLFRSHSSPNLFEKRPPSRTGIRKLSVMQENSPLLDVSGIKALDQDSRDNTPKMNQINPKDTISMPVIYITPDQDEKFHEKLQDFNVDLNKELSIDSLKDNHVEQKTVTPKNTQVFQKTSSLEKIINRFKKVRANVVSETKAEEFNIIVEEKENMNIINIETFTAKRILLPDLLSPSCSGEQKSTHSFENITSEIEEKVCRKPRESLGTALGVDQTFLDQFDLID